MSPYLVHRLILEFFPARLAMLPYGSDSNVAKLLANMQSQLYFIILQIVLCNFVSIKNIIIIIMLLLSERIIIVRHCSTPSTQT